jgi:hypothetical protein
MPAGGAPLDSAKIVSNAVIQNGQERQPIANDTAQPNMSRHLPALWPAHKTGFAAESFQAIGTDPCQ